MLAGIFGLFYLGLVILALYSVIVAPHFTWPLFGLTIVSILLWDICYKIGI